MKTNEYFANLQGTNDHFEAGSVLIVSNLIFFLFMQKKGSTELCENEFRKIMDFLADYLKMIKLYEKIFCDSGEHFKELNQS